MEKERGRRRREGEREGDLSSVILTPSNTQSSRVNKMRHYIGASSAFSILSKTANQRCHANPFRFALLWKSHKAWKVLLNGEGIIYTGKPEDGGKGNVQTWGEASGNAGSLQGEVLSSLLAHFRGRSVIFSNTGSTRISFGLNFGIDKWVHHVSNPTTKQWNMSSCNVSISRLMDWRDQLILIFKKLSIEG